MTPLSSLAPLPALQQRWQRLAPREKKLVAIAVALVATALLWWVALAPALQTLRQAPERHRSLDAQLQSMQRMQAQALQLQAQARSLPANPVSALQQATTQELERSGQLQIVGDRATLTLVNAPADSVAQWLTQARSNARALPLEVSLTQAPAPTPQNPPRWNGRIVLALTLPDR